MSLLKIPPDLNSHQYKSQAALKRLVSSSIDHTLLKADATPQGIETLCQEAIEFNFYSVCVNSGFVGSACRLLKGHSVKTITVVGFPLGAALAESKAYEAQKAIELGAQEIDMVLSIGQAKAGNWSVVAKDIALVRKATNQTPLKVILETSYFTDEEISKACSVAKESGADFVKTSTGFSSSGATTAHIKLMRQAVQNELGVKASGGIKTLFNALAMLQAGANRLGTSSSCQIVSQIQENSYAEFLSWNENPAKVTSNKGY